MAAMANVTTPASNLTSVSASLSEEAIAVEVLMDLNAAAAAATTPKNIVPPAAMGATFEESSDESSDHCGAELARLGPLAEEFLVLEGVADVHDFVSRKAQSLAEALSAFMLRAKQKQRAASTTQGWIWRWRRDVLQRRETLKEEGLNDLHPTFEIFDGEVRSFFASMSIFKPKDLLSFECRALICEWINWRHENGEKTVNPKTAAAFIRRWRQSVEEQVKASVSTDELARLGPFARAFFASQGLAHVEGFLLSPLKDIVPELIEFREHNEYRPLGYCSLRQVIMRWRRDLLQRRETLKENVQGVHPMFEIFSEEVRSFFKSMSISEPQDLLAFEYHSTINGKWMAWQKENTTAAINEEASRRMVVHWRESVFEQAALGPIETVKPAGTVSCDLDAPEQHSLRLSATVSVSAPREAETTAPDNPLQVARPAKKRLRRTDMKRTYWYPRLSSGVSADEPAAAPQESTAVSPSATDDGSDIGSTDQDCSSDNSCHGQKRARVEEEVRSPIDSEARVGS